MRTLRLAGALGGFCLLLLGCSSQGANGAGELTELEVVQITTLTTVQASSGIFLSPSAQQDLPSYVARGDAAGAVEPTDGLDRAKVEVALLFRGGQADLPEVTAKLSRAGDGEWSPIQGYFPAVTELSEGARWPIELFRTSAELAPDISTEWSGWQGYGGLHVRAPGTSATDGPNADVARLEFELRGAQSPLLLSNSNDVDLNVSNQSTHAVERALLVYSHAGGVGVRAINALGPGAGRITALGPKEHPPETLLEEARAQLRDFFAASVGDELGAAMADAKSIPFLETRGLRIISLLETTAAPLNLDLAAPATLKLVVVSHSEILKLDEETRILSVVADQSLNLAAVTHELGRFSEAKLEYAAVGDDAATATRAQGLLADLRSR